MERPWAKYSAFDKTVKEAFEELNEASYIVSDAGTTQYKAAPPRLTIF